MEQGNDKDGFTIQEEAGDMVDGNGQAPIAGIKLDLDGKINKYLRGTGAAWWPMRVFQITNEKEMEEAEAWIKELIGKVLNS